jgi:hypothetical protein
MVGTVCNEHVAAGVNGNARGQVKEGVGPRPIGERSDATARERCDHCPNTRNNNTIYNETVEAHILTTKHKQRNHRPQSRRDRECQRRNWMNLNPSAQIGRTSGPASREKNTLLEQGASITGLKWPHTAACRHLAYALVGIIANKHVAARVNGNGRGLSEGGVGPRPIGERKGAAARERGDHCPNKLNNTTHNDTVEAILNTTAHRQRNQLPKSRRDRERRRRKNIERAAFCPHQRFDMTARDATIQQN